MHRPFHQPSSCQNRSTFRLIPCVFPIHFPPHDPLSAACHPPHPFPLSLFVLPKRILLFPPRYIFHRGKRPWHPHLWGQKYSFLRRSSERIPPAPSSIHLNSHGPSSILHRLHFPDHLFPIPCSLLSVLFHLFPSRLITWLPDRLITWLPDRLITCLPDPLLSALSSLISSFKNINVNINNFNIIS